MQYFENTHMLPFSDLTDEQQLFITKAKQQGKVQTFYTRDRNWRDATTDCIYFHSVYRVLPTTVTKHELYDAIVSNTKGTHGIANIISDLFKRGIK